LISTIAKAALLIDVPKPTTTTSTIATNSPAPVAPTNLVKKKAINLEQRARRISPFKKQQQWMTVKIARLQITVLDDRWNQNIPLVDLCVNNLNASAANWSSDLKVNRMI